jgi:hypothetical protein
MHACMPPEVQPTLITCAISGNQWQSGAIRGNQGATDAHHLCNQGQSGAIRGNQGQPTLITCAKSE